MGDGASAPEMLLRNFVEITIHTPPFRAEFGTNLDMDDLHQITEILQTCLFRWGQGQQQRLSDSMRVVESKPLSEKYQTDEMLFGNTCKLIKDIMKKNGTKIGSQKSTEHTISAADRERLTSPAMALALEMLAKRRVELAASRVHHETLNWLQAEKAALDRSDTATEEAIPQETPGLSYPTSKLLRQTIRNLYSTRPIQPSISSSTGSQHLQDQPAREWASPSDLLDKVTAETGSKKLSEGGDCTTILQMILSERQTILAERQTVLAEKLSILRERQSILDERRSVVAEKQSTLEKAQTNASGKPLSLAQQESILPERQEFVAEMKSIIEEQRSLISERAAIFEEEKSVLEDEHSTSSKWMSNMLKMIREVKTVHLGDEPRWCSDEQEDEDENEDEDEDDQENNNVRMVPIYPMPQPRRPFEEAWTSLEPMVQNILIQDGDENVSEEQVAKIAARFGIGIVFSMESMVRRDAHLRRLMRKRSSREQE